MALNYLKSVSELPSWPGEREHEGTVDYFIEVQTKTKRPLKYIRRLMDECLVGPDRSALSLFTGIDYEQNADDYTAGDDDEGLQSTKSDGPNEKKLNKVSRSKKMKKVDQLQGSTTSTSFPCSTPP